MVMLEQKRNELFHYLRVLASPDYQQQVWIDGNYLPEIGHDCFGYAVTFFFEDTFLAEDPTKNLGTILENQDEVPVIRNVADALYHVLSQLGEDCTDAEYVNHPDWHYVVNAANEAADFYGL